MSTRHASEVRVLWCGRLSGPGALGKPRALPSLRKLTCFLLLGQLRHRPPWVKAVAGAGIITAVELAAGLLVNRKYAIWDYRDTPLNFMGQICLPYSLLWMPVGLAGSEIYRLLDRKKVHP